MHGGTWVLTSENLVEGGLPESGIVGICDCVGRAGTFGLVRVVVGEHEGERRYGGSHFEQCKGNYQFL